MTGRKAVIGLCAICALIVSALAASDAGAATTVTCVASETGPFNTTCNGFQSGPNGGKLVNFAGNTKVTGVSEGKSVLKGTVSGVTLELTATELAVVGELENREAGGVMETTGTGTVEYRHVTTNHGCLVNGASSGTVTTNLLHVHSLSTTELKFEPNSGTTFMEFTLSECAIPALDRTVGTSGSVIGFVNGTMVEFTHSGTTTQGTLKVSGNKAGLEEVLLLKGENGNPLAMS